MTDDTKVTGLPVPPTVLGGTAAYDMIMKQIEPDLTTTGVKILAEKYKEETPGQTRQRATRYKAAFQEYLRRYREYAVHMHGTVREYVSKTIFILEQKSGVDDAQVLQHIVSLIQAIPA